MLWQEQGRSKHHFQSLHSLKLLVWDKINPTWVKATCEWGHGKEDLASLPASFLVNLVWFWSSVLLVNEGRWLANRWPLVTVIGWQVASRYSRCHWLTGGQQSLWLAEMWPIVTGGSSALFHWVSVTEDLEEFLGLWLIPGPARLGLAVLAAGLHQLLAASLHQLCVRPAGLVSRGAAGGGGGGGLQGAWSGQLYGAGGGGHLQGTGGGGGVPLGAGATLLDTVAASVGQLGGHECF